MHKLNNIRRFLAIVAVLASLIVIATIAFRVRKGDAPKLGVRKLPVQVDISLQKVHYTEVKQGVKQWDLSADRAEYNKKTDTTSLTGVRLAIAGGAGTGDLLVTAERAEYHNGRRDVVLAGNVHGQSSKGIEFSTSRVTYVAARSQLETAEPVRFVDAGLELEGVGMEFHTQTRRFKLMKDVSAVYRPQGAR
ncbi:MAG: LPS export ABC transporter periplasmic protein LptC [Geobacteraceae bacterium GWC2_58_44]|nr:MAG: LPS export ABC transporter periplasmic protein LptC [Geobacteraceae bacterium GWC2_58_44]HBG08330.1 LPS export ABC transporter periplasmic protein LptC [Geobacter sp.]